MIVLKKSFRLTDKDSDTHTNFNFTVPRDARALVVSFSYYPKNLRTRSFLIACSEKRLLIMTKAWNLTTRNWIAIFRSKTFLPFRWTARREGRAPPTGRAMFKKHVISHSGSSQGFVKQKITRGVWNITVSAHSIVTPYVDVLLEAEIE